jgi:hypothetical protein
MTIEIPITPGSFPCNDPKFYDQFEIGHTILSILFLEWTEEYVPAGSKKKGSMFLVEKKILGLYEGREDDSIRIADGIESLQAIPVGHIRGVKIEDIVKLGDLLASATKAIFSAGVRPDPITVVGSVNDLRRVVDANAILIPRERVA